MISEASNCIRCLHWGGCFPWEITRCRTAFVFIPGLGLLTSGYDWIQSRRELKQINIDLRLESPTDFSYYLDSDDPLFDIEQIKPSVNPHEVNMLSDDYTLQEKKPIVTAKKTNSAFLFVVNSMITAGAIVTGLYAFNKI